MRKKEFQLELERRRKKQESLKVKKSPFKDAIKNTTIFIMSTALITYPLNFPYTNAHFTDKITYGIHNILGMRTSNKLNTGAVKLFFDIHRFNNIHADFDVNFAESILVVSMGLPDGSGFSASDIIVDSVKFTYNDGVIDITPMNVETSGNEIKLTFNWHELESFIDSDDNTPVFDISGKGAGEGLSGLGERFIFVGHGRIVDLEKEFFEQMDYSYFIEGRQVITIPSEEDGAAIYTYRFYVDNKEVPADEVEWRLSQKIGGVEFESGELSVYSDAQAANIVITAQLNSNRYFVSELDIELIKVEEEIPELIEQGDGVTLPTSPDTPNEDIKEDDTTDGSIDEEDSIGDQGSANDGSTNDGTADEGSADDGGTNDGTAGEGSADDGGTNDGTADEGSANDGSTNDDTGGGGSSDDGGTNDGTADEGSANDGSTNGGTADEGSADDGGTNDGTADEGSADDGGTNDGTADEGSADDGGTNDGTAGEGSVDDDGMNGGI